MKKILFGLLCVWPLCAQTQEVPNEQQEKPIALEVIAPRTVSFMGRTFHFSYWEAFADSSYWPNPVLTLDPSKKYQPNKNGVPRIYANYHLKKGVTPHTFLDMEDEHMSFDTQPVEPSRNARTKVIPCGEDVVDYAVFEGEEAVTTVIAKNTQEGTIIFSGVLKRNPKKSVQVHTKRVETDFGTFTQERETVTFDTKSIEKEAKRYAQAMCREPFPEWLKQVPTIQEIQNQANEQAQRRIVPMPIQKTGAPRKPVSIPSKTVVPKLQSAQPAYRSGK